MVRDVASTASLLAHGAALLLAGALLVVWCRLHPKRRAGVALTAIAMGAFTAYLSRVPSAAIPASWATALQEGLDGQNIRTLYGIGAHAGRNFAIVIRALADSDTPNLHDV